MVIEKFISFSRNVETDAHISSVKKVEEKMFESLLNSVNPKAKQRVKILLAEDSDDDYFFISEALSRSTLNYELSWVRNGSEAFEWLCEQYGKGMLPDLFLLDINMPKLNGHEVLEKLRADFRFKNLLTIVLTSSKSPTDIEMAYEKGANSFIVKNSRFDKLVSIMNALKTFWFDVAELPKERSI